MQREPIRIGDSVYHVIVQPLVGGDFTFFLLQIDQRSSPEVETRFGSQLRFESASDAYEGGCAQIRLRARRGRF